MLLTDVSELITREDLIRCGERIVVAVSGGPDSVTLLHLLNRLRADMSLHLHVAHLDHMFRGEASRQDADFVRRLSGELGLDCTVRAVDVPAFRAAQGISSAQEAARIVRYAFLAEIAEQTKAAAIAVAHNADDQIESILLNLMRGTGPEGLKGMSYRTGNIIRPLLDTPRADIEAYCRRHALETRLDISNTKPYYARNRVRAELLPLMESFNPSVKRSIRRMSRLVTDDDALLAGLAEEKYQRALSRRNGQILLADDMLGSLPPSLQRRVVRHAVAEARGDLRDIGMDHIEDILSLLAKPVGASLDIPALKVCRDYRHIIFGDLAQPVIEAPVEFPLDVPGDNRIPDAGVRLRIYMAPAAVAADIHPGKWVLLLDADRLPGRLLLRFRRPGDRLYPIGMKGSRKLQDIFVDARIPRWQRERIPLLDAGGQVLWIIGCRPDRRWLPDAGTTSFLVLEAEPLDTE